MSNDIHFFDQMKLGLTEIQKIPAMDYRYNPRKQVYKRGKTKLYHYQAKVENPARTPLLIVFATVNRPEVLDLFPSQSFIGNLLANGLDVYLLDWGYPDAQDTFSFADYINDYLHHCVQFIGKRSKQKAINLLGICQGGVLSLAYSILHKKIKNLVLISTPIDFHTEDNTITKFLQKIDIDSFINAVGNIPGRWLTQFFISLRPFELLGRKYLRFIDGLENTQATEKFLYVEKWLHDAPDQCARAFTQFAKDFYQENKWIKNELVIGDEKVDLKELAIPVLNIMAQQDEIIPMSASKPLKNHARSANYTEKVFDGGHIGIYISDKVVKKMAKEITHWLEQHD